MRFLVTGGAGFIGSHTVEELVRLGHEAVVLDDLSTGKADNLGEVKTEIKLIQDSVANLDAVRRACSDADCVIHLAAQTSVPRSVKDPIETNLINVDGTLNVLVAARDAKVRRVVFASSCAIYGTATALPIRESTPAAPISPYGVSKWVGEAYGRTFQDLYGVEFVALRYFNVFGPRQDPRSPYSGVLSRFCSALLQGTPPTVYGDGKQSRDFVYVGNVAHANLLAAQHRSAPGMVFNIGTGNRYTLNQTLATLGRITGRPLQANHEPAREGDIRDSQADITLAWETLGYQPRYGFEDGLRHTWDWFSGRRIAVPS